MINTNSDIQLQEDGSGMAGAALVHSKEEQDLVDMAAAEAADALSDQAGEADSPLTTTAVAPAAM